MKLVAHISDPHFGTHDPAIAAELLLELRTFEPAVVAISGDLTQRARRSQFRAARDWLAHLGVPYVVVPGNHDIPLYDVVRRFTQPRDRYRDYISRDLAPCFVDDSLAVCGIDTTRAFTTKYGVARREQIDQVVHRFLAHEHRWRIVVAHHPFMIPPGESEPIVGGAGEAIERLERAGVDLILTGHLHAPHSHSAADRNERHTLIHVHAGTSMSTRTRREPNGYNQLAFAGDTVTIVHRVWNGRHFVDGESKTYVRSSGGDRGSRDRDRYVRIHTHPSDTPADTRDTAAPSARG